nr:hypothetical protein [Tanacetum cinerariifolium]GFA53658.1 hypothetical protein [Tanacetum cinerariifolium]
GLILLDHCLSHALTANVDVPVVYLQQFWWTVSKVPDTEDIIKFMLDTQQITYTVDMFRDTLHLPVKTPENPFVAPANINTIKAFINRVSYQGVVDKLFHPVLNQTHVDYAALLWWDFINNVFQKKEAIQYPRFIKSIAADLMKKFLNIPKRLKDAYHSIKHDVPLVSVYTIGNVSVRGMLIPDAFLTAEIRETNDFKEYETMFMKDDDDSEDMIEPRIHMDNPEVVDDDDDKEREKQDEEMGSLEVRNEETQTIILTPLSSPRKILSLDKKTFQELKDIVSNLNISTSKHSTVKKRISSKYSHLSGALRMMCRRQGYMIQDMERKCVTTEFKAHAPAIIKELFKNHVQSNVIHVHPTISTKTESFANLQYQLEDAFHSHHDEHQDDDAPPGGRKE